MNPKIRADWVAALRSGDYEQGRGALRTSWPMNEDREDEFCILGVLCDLAVKAGVDIEIGHSVNPGLGSILTQYGDSALTLPGSVREWAGLVSTSPAFEHHLIRESPVPTLAALNDTGRTFAVIANVIESGVEVMRP